MSRSHPGEPAGALPDSLDLLEFSKVAAHLAGLTRTGPGRALALALQALADSTAIATALAEAAEAMQLLVGRGPLPVGDGDDLLPLLDSLQVEGTWLPAEAFAAVLAAVEAAAACRAALADSDGSPLLRARSLDLVPLPQLAAAIRRSIGPRGEILDSASTELGHLRREVQIVRARLKRQLEGLLADERYAGVFQEQLITDRNGRYVLPVRTDHSGRLRGFVHDVSASGQTLYVEPAATLEGNNRLQMLLREVQREEERILRQLTGMVRAARTELAGNQAILAIIDLRQGIARFARDIDAVIPQLADRPLLELAAARHPLLALKLGEVVPVDLRLGDDDRVLIISGPNTGGKTVALKTAGLLVLMARAGLPLPCAPGSRLFPFVPVMADIGDDQSLEHSLSTFSGHLSRVREILANAGPQALVLLDELGTGTDPGEGGALALAVLDRLRHGGARVIATTHLHLIKGYAHLEDGVVNAAVEFDAETLQPSFRLHYGIPGASHAFTIARRLGLPDELLAQADRYLGHGEREGLAVLERLQSLRAALDEELQVAGSLRRQAEREHEQQRRLREELEARQRTILEEVRQRGGRLLGEAEAQLKKLFREARQGELPPAREQARLTGELRALRQELPQPQAVLPGVVPVSAAVGELLFVVALGVDARVIGSDGASVELEWGGKRLRQSLNALRQYQPPRFAPAPAKVPKVNDRVVRRPFRPRLVVVGRRVDEALDLVAAFLDEALLHGEKRLEIVHGAGEGILRRAIREFLAGRGEVAGFGAAGVSEGGDNVTVVELGR